MVATPTKDVASGGAFTTFDTDVVMAGVRLIFPVDTLPANYEAPFILKDLTGHGFEESYLGHAPSRAKIMQDIIAAGASRKRAAPLKITLSGSNAGRYSLYVIEPGGRQVYYQDRNGDYGTWTTKDGVDTYVTSGPVPEGDVYNIKVYYSNTERVAGEATIKLEAGAWSHTATMRFDQPEPISALEKPRDFGWVKAPPQENGDVYEVKQHL